MGMLLTKFCLLTIALQLLYHWGYRKSTDFHLNRWTLLFGMFFCFILPWIPLEYETSRIYLASPVLSIAQSVNTPTIPSQQVLISGQMSWFSILYGTGIFVLCMLRIRDLFKIFLFKRKGLVTEFPEYKLIETDVPSPFSFGRNIFLPIGLEEYERESVLYHERIHVKQCHYLDLWFCELFCILQWFNPFAWKYKQALMENHEFLADEAASQTIGLPTYQQVLTNYWLRGNITNLIHPFAYSTQLIRLSMLRKKKTFFSPKRSLITLAFILLVYGWLFAKPIVIKLPQTLNGTIQVAGTITDTQGEYVMGASVVISSKRTGTLSDFDGNFLLSNIEQADTLSVFMHGFERQNILLIQYPEKNGRIELDIQLVPQKK